MAPIVGIGDAVTDVLVRVTPEFLSTITDQPGGCIPVTGDEMEQLLDLCSKHGEPLRHVQKLHKASVNS